jgi:hypothetical protein
MNWGIVMKMWMKATTAVLVLGMAGQAQASDTNGFGVGTSAVTGQYLDIYGGVGSSVSAYRMGQDSSGNYTRIGDVAPASHDNCVNYPGQCSATHGGTNVAGFDETFSTSNSGVNWNGGLVSASTYANLATGKLGANGETSYYQTALTVASLRDTLNFYVAGAEASTITNIMLKFQLDGGLFAPDAPIGTPSLGTRVARVDDYFTFGGAFGRATFERIGGNDSYGTEAVLNQRVGQGGWVSFSWDVISPGMTQFTGVYALNGASQTLGISNDLSGFAQSIGSFTYGNTSSLNFVLPTNVTFTSASGVFLSGLGGPGAVPEPASWALMIAGFGIVGSALRSGNGRRRSKARGLRFA